VLGDDFPSPRAVFGRILGAATLVAVLALLGVLLATGHLAWELVTFVGILWAVWGFIGGLFSQLIEPAGRFLANQFTGNLPMPEQNYTLDEQTARLEHLLTQGLRRHQEILIGVRLAEIYRTHQRDAMKSEALLARLRDKYPDAQELTHDGRS
jgi:hypothetical protein